MSQVDLIMPKMGESVHEATIIKWLKKEGDKIAMDEPVLEIATDKVDSEIPSTAEGVLTKCLYKEGDIVQVGKPIAVIASGSAATPPTSPAVSKITVADASTPLVASSIHTQPASIPTNSSNGKFYSPLVKNIAKHEGLTLAELETISGTGKEGRVTKTDILAYLPTKKQNTPAVTVPDKKTLQVSPVAESPAPVVPVSAGDELIEMDRMRKLIADHMVMSKRVSPHVTSYVEVDVTNIVRWRDKVKTSFEKREGEKITFTPLFIEAVANAIRDFPMINVSVDGTKIIKKKNINIGMATALPSGNLIVPVIKNADRLNLLGLTKSVNDLANRARMNKLQPDEIQGGTFTITNVGGFGNVMGAPIINQPQVAIMAIGVIKKKPVVIESKEGDTIAIRSMMFISLSYDHRVVDGMLGGSFLRRTADYLEKFDTNRAL
jgi:2-oxoglutarate dehydrogenase E2 component (dihydrolipoamide succinyltransferase)